jgi:glycerol kinase
MAFQVRDMTDVMAAASPRPLSALRADGGAATMDLLLALQAEQSRMPVARPRSLESTALGAATIAGLAEGVWSSLGELAALWQADAVFEPSLPVELADAAHAVWRRAVEKSMGWADSAMG